MVKRRHHYDLSYNYMEEVVFPTLKQRWFLLHTDPVWYRFILTGIVVEALVIIFMTPFQMKLFSNYHIFFIRVQQIFNAMYACDLILTFRQKFFFKYRYPYPNPIRRPAPVMIMEIASILPFEIIFSKVKANQVQYSQDDRRFYMGLNTLHIFKLARFFHHVYNNRRDLHNELRTRIIEMIIVIMTFSGFVVHVLHLLEVFSTHYEIYDGFQLITSTVAGRGPVLDDTRVRYYSVFALELSVTCLSIVMWAFAVYPTTCFMILSFIENQQHTHAYSYLIQLFKTKISQKYGLSAERRKMMMDYFEANWKLRGGFSKMEFDFAQAALEVEISMDTCWSVFKHSMLFRRAEFYVLRALADKFDKLIRMEGEYIFQKGKKKLGMIYIAQGVIEILSSENNESGILSLAAGSCVGEAALIIPHASPVNFRCKTVCLLYELSRDNFIYFQKSFPSEYKQLQLKLFDNLNKVRKIQAYNAQFKQADVERKRLIWLKYHLHNLMSYRSSSKNIHEQTNIYLRQELEEEVNNQRHIFHIYEYLDKLAIRERTFTDVDLVFIRNTCPWILKAGSPITNMWEHLIVVTTVLCSLGVSYGYCIEYTESIQVMTWAVHIIFAFDLVVQIITPVSVESDSSSLATVLSERLRTRGFFLDIISIFYWKMIAFALDTDRPWYELFKLVKLWRLYHFFEAWGNRFLVNMLIFTVVTSVTTYIILIYCLSCFFTLFKFTDQVISPVAIQFATGAGLPFVPFVNYTAHSYAFVFANGTSLTVYLTVVAMMCSSFYLSSISRYKIITIINTLSDSVSYKDNSWLRLRLEAYFNILRHDTDALLSGGNISRLYELPKYFEIVMKSNVHLEALKKLLIFKNLSDELLTNMLLHSEIFTCYKRSIVISRGVIYKEVFVLIRGELRTLINGTYLQTKTNEPLNFLENCYNFPAVISTIALTDCLLLKFSFSAFLYLLSESTKDYLPFKRTLSITEAYNKSVMLKLLYEPLMIIRSRHRRPNLKKFKFFAARNSFEEYDYHVPFDKIRPFDFIKFLLLRTTFMPEGEFLKTYEIVRCCMAFVSACAFTIPALNVGAYTTKSKGYPLMLALDLFAIVDIYMRMHVCYYNEDGVLITHPLYTAKYYLSHGFFIDFIAVFPFDIFPMKVQYRALMNAIHALQLHRLLAMRAYFSTHKSYYIMNTIWLICYTLFAANFIAGLLFVYDCYNWSTEVMVPEAKCQTFRFEKTEAHFHILFLVMSALQCNGMTGLIDVSVMEPFLAVSVSLLTVVGGVMHIFHKAYIFSSHLTRIIVKYKYIVGVRRLLRLLAQGMPDNADYLCKEVENYYDLHWDRVASQNLAFLTKNMINALRRDMLFRFYGDNLVVHSIFTDNTVDTTLFIKNMFLVAQPMVIPKGGYAVSINDIIEHIYFLNHGSVDLLAPDGSKIRELTEGAIFGNFSGDIFTRMKISIVANVNTDLIYVTGADFFQIIAYFPQIRATCEKLIKQNIYYIESTKEPEPHLKMTFEEYISAVNRYAVMKILTYVHLYLVCYLGVCIELYQLAVGEMHMYYLIIQYSLDMLHLFHEYFKFRLPYKDEHRVPIFNMKSIIAMQMSNRTELFVMIATVIYLDLFLVVGLVLFGRYSFDELSYYITALRLNRLLRIYYIKAAYDKAQARVSSSVPNILKWIHIIYWFILSYQMVAAITALLDSLTIGDAPNLIRNISAEKIRNLRYLPSTEKIEIYLRYLFFANLIHVNTNNQNYQPSNITFNIYIIILFLYRLVVDAILLCRFFEAMVDIVVLRRLYLKGASFLKFYVNKSVGTFIIKDRVVENAKHAWTKNYYKSDLIMQMVCAKYLKEVIIHNLYGYLLRRHPVFAHTHLDFMRQLGVHLNKVIYPCNFVIVYQKEMRNCMFFIHKGSVAVYDVDFGYEDIAVDILQKGDSFGFRQGLAPLQAVHDYTYITTSHCEIIELKWDSWNYLLPFFPATEEYIFQEAPKYHTMTSIPFTPKEFSKEYW